jgi:hypothetical protein
MQGFANVHFTSQSLPHRARYLHRRARAQFKNWRDNYFRSPAASFYAALQSGYDPEAHIDVLPAYSLIYVSIPKNASTTIRAFLSGLNGQQTPSPETVHTRRRSGILSPARAGLSTFHQIATSPTALRFSFVRNPYARLVSAWADKFSNKQLAPGDSFIDIYLNYRTEIGDDRAIAPGATLSFERFLAFASATAGRRQNAHWNLQHDLLDFPGLSLNFVGAVERFGSDFAHVVERLGVGASQIKPFAGNHYNPSRHRAWRDYYTPALAKMVYRAYERDFDRFKYPSSI